MCKDGKCQERAGQTRNTIIKLAEAARELAKLGDFPHMVVKTPTHIALVPADPALAEVPGMTLIMDVYPTSTDDEIARKTDRYMIEGARSNSMSLIQMLEKIFSLEPTPSSVAQIT